MTNPTRPDHPANLLRREAERLSQPEVHRGTITHPIEWQHAADLLRDYEVEKGITFEALDTDTLASIHNHWALLGRAVDEDEGDVRGEQLISALLGDLRDLLGLEH